METTLSDEQREYVRTIRESGVGLLTVIHDILTLSQLEAGSLEPEESSLDPQQTIETIQDMFSSESDAKGLELVFWIDWNVPPTIRTDGARLRQILVNLVSNAVKFTRRGRVAVTVSVKERAGDVIDLEWTVADTGPGIPADRIGRLFKPFSQIDMSDTREHGGTGLGLAIAARLSERLGGSIRVDSTFGSGSSFIVSIRAKIVPGGDPAAAKASRPQIAGKNIWILASDPLQRKVIRDLVARHGAECLAGHPHRGSRSARIVVRAGHR
jgi:signal transduction histidine kinase